MRGKVTECLCAEITFKEWLHLKQTHGWSLDEAATRTKAGEECGACKPYLYIVQDTGITELPVMPMGVLLTYPYREGSRDRFGKLL